MRWMASGENLMLPPMRVAGSTPDRASP